MPTTDKIRRRFLGMVLQKRYCLDDLIGHGGMGAVFRATDQKLGRQVAVKVIWDDNVPDSWRVRFVREARLPSDVHDVNVVIVHDLSSHVDAISGRELDFIVMELLHGEDLAAWLRRRGSIDLAQAIEILLQAARGVAAVHRSGILHRDVKPRNLIVVPVATGGILVKVVDFGIAKSLTTTDEFGDITVAGFMGSERYASPEQVHGRSEPGRPSDVFSLGVVAYELLTGTLPFSDEDRARLSQNLPVPLRRPSVLNPTVPPQVDSVVVRCLNLDPAGRYADAQQVVDALISAREAAGQLAAPVADEGTARPPEWTDPDLTVLHTGGGGRAARGGRGGTRVPSGSNHANVKDASGPQKGSAPAIGDRRVNQTEPRPARWRPGRSTWVAVAACAAVIAIVGLGQTKPGASLFATLVAMFNKPGEIHPGRPLAGELDRGDSAAAGKRYDVFRYRGEKGTSFFFSLDSAEFDGELEWGRVADGAWKPLESSGGMRPAQIMVTLNDTVEYRLRVRARQPGGAGRYVVQTRAGPRTVRPGATVASRLTAADGRAADGVRNESWALRAPPGRQITVTVRPEGFSARIRWLYLAGGRWKLLEEAMSDSSGKDAQLTVTVPESGEYRVAVRNRVKWDDGHYTLRVSESPRDLAPGVEVASRLTPADAAAEGGLPLELWAYRGVPGEPVAFQVRTRARVMVEWWRLRGGQWQQLDNMLVSRSTELLRVRPPGPGEYYLRVRAAVPGDTGRYTIKPATETTAGAVQVGQSIIGMVGASAHPLSETPYQEWSFTGTPGEWVVIDLQSGEIGASLSLGCWTADGVWKEVGQTENVYGTGSRLQVQVGGTGECVIGVTSVGLASSQGLGSYTLSVAALAPTP